MDSPGAVADSKKLPPLAAGVLTLLALVKLAVHLATGFQYGFFRDELYYIQWAERLAWGYVEQPPMTAGVIWLVRVTLGDSLFALRVVPALCGAAIVVLTGLVARELGGRRFAQGLAALCALVGPIFLATSALMVMNILDMLFWMLCLFALARLLRTGDEKQWLWLGLWAGLGLMAKLSMLFFGAGLVVALLLAPQRRSLLHKEIWFGGAIAVLLFAPFLVWLATHDWVTLEFMMNYGGGEKTYQASFLEWLGMHVLTLNPLTLPIWLTGLYFLFKHSRFRMLGWFFVILYAMFFVLRAKFYFLSPYFPVLFAAGGVQFERWLEAPRRRWVRAACAAALAISGALLAPMAIPVLPPDMLVRYTEVQGGVLIHTEQVEEKELPQHFADQIGWESMVRQMAGVYESLPGDEQAVCALFGSNYGEAAAIDFYGPEYALPGAISGHNTYYLWGPRDTTGEVIIVIASPEAQEQLEEAFESVEVAGTNDCGLCMPYERRSLFFVCRGLRMPVEQFWPSVKKFG